LTGIFLGGSKTEKKQDSRGFLFPVFSGELFCRNVVLEGVTGIHVFVCCHRIFLLEFLRDRNLYLHRIPPDSSGFLFPPEAVWLRPATKEGLFSKIWTKTALF
jgi:hypothetical protein